MSAAVVAAVFLAIGADVGRSDSPPTSSDWAMTLSGPSGYGAVGDVATYTVTAVNKGPDPSPFQWTLSAGWMGDLTHGPSGGVAYVGNDSSCSFTPAGLGTPDNINCGSPTAPIPVGATQTIHFSVKWTAPGYVTIGAGVGNFIPVNDPTLDNNEAGITLFICPSGCTPVDPGGGGGGGGGGGSGGGGGGTPVAPSYAFADNLPDATQYILYSIATVPCDPTVQCPQEVQLTSGTLPPGIKLEQDVNGGLIGSPTTPGSYTFTLTAVPNVGSNRATLTHTYTLVVEPLRSTSSGAPPPKPILPSRSRTPGVVNPAVTQATIRKTICVSQWTKTIRPPVSYTNTLKLKQMKQYGEKGSPRAYEEDNFIPLELGGAPRNPKNLWPEPHSQSKRSDLLETALERKVCAGSLTLATARKQIVAYKRTHG